MAMNVRDRLDLLPLRQMVSAAGDAQIVLARQGLLDWLAKPDKYRIVRHGDGGQILAVSELALAEARSVLRQAYGPLVTFGIPTVHTYVDTQSETLMVPVTFLRIDAPRSHAQQLRGLLADRGAEIKEMDLQRQRVVIRAEMELARSLGLQRQAGLADPLPARRRQRAHACGAARFSRWRRGAASMSGNDVALLLGALGATFVALSWVGRRAGDAAGDVWLMFGLGICVSATSAGIYLAQ
jgi:hypothetical protein